MSRSRKVFRDGKVHVCAEMCETCIFRPGNLMNLSEGRVESMVQEATKRDSCIPCHETLGVPEQDLWLYARSFHTAAKKLAASFHPDASPFTGFDASPVVFMYHHAAPEQNHALRL